MALSCLKARCRRQVALHVSASVVHMEVLVGSPQLDEEERLYRELQVAPHVAKITRPLRCPAFAGFS